jgi:hypothetical protein
LVMSAHRIHPELGDVSVPFHSSFPCYAVLCFACLRHVLCAQRCQCYWIVHSWVSLQFSLTFTIYSFPLYRKIKILVISRIYGTWLLVVYAGDTDLKKIEKHVYAVKKQLFVLFCKDISLYACMCICTTLWNTVW